MNALTSILSKMPGLKSSADFAGAIDTLEAEHSSALAVVGELESRREDAIFGSGDLSALEADILTAENRVKTLAVAMAGARKRCEQA